MKIATYNIRRGGTPRVHWQKIIYDHGVELLLVQESYHPDEHLPPLHFPQARSQSVWEPVPAYGWGSAVFSNTGSLKPVPVPGFTGWVVGAKISGASWQAGSTDPLHVFSLHAPTTNNGDYPKQVNLILDEIKRIAGGREMIVGGDFNLTVSNCPDSDRPISKADLAIQTRLADEFDLINCWQEANPNQPLPQTLRWSGDRTIPYHCDGIFVPRSWKDRLQSCVVPAGEEWNVLSDHNPVIASFS